jgi:hypothetical protein
LDWRDFQLTEHLAATSKESAVEGKAADMAVNLLANLVLL